MPDAHDLYGATDEGQTPLDPDEAAGLKLSWVATRGDLNDVEASNIVQGIAWAQRRIAKERVAEQAVRLHHRLTFIHPFANGNGRCSRVMADLFLQRHGVGVFSWGPVPHGLDVRQRYLAAVRQADAGDYTPLLAFVRS